MVTTQRPRVDFASARREAQETLSRTTSELRRLDGLLAIERERVKSAQQRIAAIESDIRLDVAMDKAAYPNESARNAAVQRDIHANSEIGGYQAAINVAELNIARMTAEHDEQRRTRQNCLATMAWDTAYMQLIASDPND